MPKIKSLKKLAVKLGYGSDVSDYVGTTVTEVLKEIAVKMGVAPSVKSIPTANASKVLDYIANNYGEEENEPYDLVITDTNVSVTVKRKNKNVSEGSDILYNGDKLTITATADEGYELSTLTVNGTAIQSGDEVTVNGKVTVVASAEAIPQHTHHTSTRLENMTNDPDSYCCDEVVYCTDPECGQVLSSTQKQHVWHVLSDTAFITEYVCENCGATKEVEKEIPESGDMM